jgi:putative MATE family efflux protein
MSLPNSLKVDTSLKGIILLTLPISMSKLIPELNYLFNAAFLGHLGSVELAMAGITGVYYLVFSAIGYGLNNALLAIMSRRAGENNRSEIFSSLWHGQILAMIIAVLFIIGTWLFLPSILTFSGIKPEAAKMASEFLNIRIWGLLFLYTLQMQSAYLISLQQTKYLVLIAVIESGMNLVLDYGMIFGHFGLPNLGFNGAAYASVISEVIGAVTIMALIKGLKITERFSIIPDYRFSFKTFKLITKQGLPLMSQLALSTGAWWVFFVLISRNYTYQEQAVTQSMRNLFGLSGVFSWAFGASANTIISNLIGQGRQSEIFIIIKRMYSISFSGMLVFVIVLNIFPYLFFDLFGQDIGFLESGLGPLRIVSVAMLILCIGVIWLNAVIATGKTKVVFWIELVGIVSYLIYVFVVTEVLNLSLEIAWMSEWVYWSTLFLLSYLYLKFGNWRMELAYT